MTSMHSTHAAVALFGLVLMAGGLTATVLSRRVIGLHVMDYPTGRSAHAAPVPKGGGLAIVAVFLVGMPVTEMIFHHVADRADITLLLATVWLGLFSWHDDMHPMPPAWKLAAQVAAASVVAGGGIAALPLPAAWAELPLRILWLVCLCNVLNFVDGLDGLAGGCTLLACLATAGLCLAAHGGVDIWGTALVLAAAMAGFLPLNFPRARLFMGDVGSQCCGLVLGALGLRMAGLPHLSHGGMLMPLILSGMLTDVSATLLRRIHAGRPLMRAHREHLYQMAHRSGMKAPRITLMAWGATAYGSLVAGAVATNRIAPSTALGLVGIVQLGWAVTVWRRVRRTPELTW
ncbi:glycosyltransferase family 4 protein [Komagataeibacter sp. FNDCR2]|uniref:glycosyltransferase family 4 protein n=1 Tax=Komagataeibacter sp. FNDCR2 TaxID=2878682 RepID=UPI001E2C4611|nr:UDP-phosphate N-acetylglucosaminyl-1-phosphate transferase [Komagataeibacter sp. FNDCR2]MCE2576463.1 UDP-phosphate N-acetylglucosaminyl-1-phosphate transferase [Komagataeibacter sp. FNDCR2]